MRRVTSASVAAIVLVVMLLLLPVAYVVAYYLLVDGDNPFRSPSYFSRSDPEPADYVFWPAHQLDRLVRPGYWGQTDTQLQREIIPLDVERGLARARETCDVDPQGAIVELKLLRDNVQRAPELDFAARARLRDRIVWAIKDAQRRQVAKDERDQLREHVHSKP